jgi:hypothetical protein
MITRPFLPLTLVGGFLLGSVSAFGQATDAVDTMFLNDATGTRRTGHIVGIDANSFKVEVTLAVGGATATVGVPRAQVSRVEFAPQPARDRLVANPVAANIPALGLEWRRWQAFLPIPKSPAGAVGNAYAAALLATGDAKQASDALALYKAVEKDAWSDTDKATAKRGRLRALVATGNAADALTEAAELAKDSEDPTVLIEAKFILAEATNAKLHKLLADNPRWIEDPLVRPERDRLYNEALDLYLHPYLFLGSETEAASRGLWGAVQVYRFGGDDANAIESSRDLVTLYKGTSYATLAQDYLNKLPADLKKQDAEKEAKADAGN